MMHPKFEIDQTGALALPNNLPTLKSVNFPHSDGMLQILTKMQEIYQDPGLARSTDYKLDDVYLDLNMQADF